MYDTELSEKEAVLGKNTGMDKDREKTTFVTLFGLEKSKQSV